ncbi:GNAT family N-acetyltransferase [Xenorhabdus hominickii]|uniref:GNAT family N-acetyltransferase n=2 Tax=Xenorhabdus hominickii TaxID=351679 RepID=A0A2G0Q019_XENHO|nr:GNAT family N-acetyltransferase [Xenorhabdus hominickii]
MVTTDYRQEHFGKIIIIRLANILDFETLNVIDTVSLHDEHRLNQIKNWIKSQFCHVIEVDGKVVAYGVLHYNFFNCGFIEILMVGVEGRRRGLGLALVNYLKSICTCSKLFTSTNQSNEPMQFLLRKAGFRESGYIENLDEDPELVFFWKK